MKTKILFAAIASALLLVMTAGDAMASVASEKSKKEQQQVNIIRGRVVDAETNQPLVFAGIAVQGSNVSTVTNLDGEFTLKLPERRNRLNSNSHM